MNEREREVWEEACKRFEVAQGWESSSRARMLLDIKFANADADNGWQWPAEISQLRQQGGRPNLTINKVRQHCLQILNDARQNKPAIKVLATGGDASSESAQVFEDVIRRIEYNSNAEDCYLNAMKFQVWGGIGYFRIRTDYVDDDSFDQEILIEPINDPMMVMMDPNMRQKDGSDADYAFVYSDIPKDRFAIEYPQYKDKVGISSSYTTVPGWLSGDTVRIAEYYRVKKKKFKLIAYQVPNPMTGEMETKVERADNIPGPIRGPLMRDPTTRTRKVIERIVEWYKIAGDQIIDSTTIPSQYIPICRVIGEETIIDGQLDRKGHVRAMKDPQRMYNYHASAGVESIAVQNLTPYVGPIKAFEGFENIWKNSNIQRPVFLPYNHIDEESKEIPAPQRQEPPTLAAAFPEMLRIATDQLESVSGQREAMFGQSANDQSGKAINALQARGDNSTYHYIDNLAGAIRFCGKVLIDMIPKVYDTPRIIKIRAEDGTESAIKIDPNQEEAVQQTEDEREAEASAIFNPSVGKYDVIASVGPGYQTRRRETFDKLSEILTSPTGQVLVPVTGDLLFKAADFPMADEISERLRRTIPANILGEGPSPEVQAAQAQIEQLQQVINETLQALADKSKEHEIDEQQKQIDVYEAITKRLDVALKNQPDPQELATLTAKIVLQALTKPLPNPMEAEHSEPDIGMPDPTVIQ